MARRRPSARPLRERGTAQLLAVGISVGVWVALCAGLALPASPSGADVDAQGTRIEVTTGGSGSGGGGRPRGSAAAPTYRNCQTSNLGLHIVGPILAVFGRGGDAPTDQAVAWRSCERIADGEEVGWITGLRTGTAQAPAPPSATDLAAAAAAELDLPLPDVSTSPPRGGIQLDGVPIWFWVERPEPVTATASVPGLSATLTATARGARFAISDGTAFDCPDLGTPYDPGRPTSSQHTTCSHVFDDRGTFTVTATVTWELAWVASTGESGTLPPQERTTTFDLDLQEGQAVTG